MNEQAQQLETLLRDCNLGWAIDMFTPPTRAAEHYLSCLQALDRYIVEKKLGEAQFSPVALARWSAASSFKAEAFLQALVSIRGTPILCAAWRIIQGMKIEELVVEYSRMAEFLMQVVLTTPEGICEAYSSTDISDAVFLRHLGKSKIDGKPLFDGFYALMHK